VSDASLIAVDQTVGHCPRPATYPTSVAFLVARSFLGRAGESDSYDTISLGLPIERESVHCFLTALTQVFCRPFYSVQPLQCKGSVRVLTGTAAPDICFATRFTRCTESYKIISNCTDPKIFCGYA